MEAARYYATAAAAGIIGGWTFALIWARLVPLSVQGQFWSSMTGFARSMLVAERSREFLDLYRRLGVSLVRYLGRNIGGLLLACLPITALTFALSVYPHGAATLQQQWNPLFPYLNDLEFIFFGMATLGAAGALLLRQKRA